MVSLDWLTVDMFAPCRIGFASLPWASLVPVRWDYELDPDPGAWRAYLIQPTDIRTAQFACVAYLTDLSGEKVATIWSAPHNPLLHGAEWMQVQFANATLYSGEWVHLFRMFRAIGCTYRAVSRVDIACDGIEGDGGDWPKVLTMAAQGAARYYGKADWLTRGTRGRVIGGEFGSRRSNKFVRAYRKKREMKSKGLKPYIAAAWERAFGFDAWADPAIEVNRFEVSLKGKEIRRYFPAERTADWVEGLHGIGQRVDVFASMAPSLFDFRTDATRARDAVPVCRWDWSAVHADPTLAPRAPRRLALSDHTLKTGLRSLWHLAHVTGDAAGFDACERMARAGGPTIADWYERKRFQWIREFGRLEAARDARTMDVLERMRNNPSAEV